MSDTEIQKKKVVFKVNFSNESDMPKRDSEPQMVTEWNYIRVGIATFVILVLIVIGMIISGDDEQAVTEESISESEKNAEPVQKGDKLIKPLKIAKPDKEPEVKLTTEPAKETQKIISDKKPVNQKPKASSSVKAPGRLVRAMLSRGIWKNSPFGEVEFPIKVDTEKATGIFYFTELENMAGQSIFHVWKRDGEVIFEKEKRIEENQWRTYTSKLFTIYSAGSWSVEVIDSKGNQLNVIHFKVVAE